MKSNKLMGCIGIVVFAVVLVITMSAATGITVAMLWNWFVVTIFGLPQLTLWEAYGVALLVGALTYQNTTSNNDEEDAWLPVVRHYIQCALYVATGWIVYSVAF